MSSGEITPEAFINAFVDEWSRRIRMNPVHVLDQYADDAAWTEFMLGASGILATLSSALNHLVNPLVYYRELYTVDALLVGGEDLFRGGLIYPSVIHAMFEHENGENVEEEMWKLMFWRAPLKVLIFYDWSEENKSTSRREHWLARKMATLWKMLDRVEARRSQNDDADYIFLVGRRNSEEQIEWDVASNNPLNLTLERPFRLLPQGEGPSSDG